MSTPLKPITAASSTPLTLCDLNGKVTFDASSLHALLLDNGRRAGSLPRSANEPPGTCTPAPLQQAPKYSLRSMQEEQPVSAPTPALRPGPVEFPTDLAHDAKMASIPPYAAVPPSVASSRRRRGQAKQAVASPLLQLATLATAGGAKASRLPQHARLQR